MYILEFKSEVYDDIQTAYDWYEQQRKGLGEDFLLSLEDSYAKILRSPKAYQTTYKVVRRKLMRRFPFGIFFLIRDTQIIVIAILHTRRSVTAWSNRL